MPDIIRRVSNIYNKRLHDFEDDTHAEVIAARIISGGQTDALTNAQLRADAVSTEEQRLPAALGASGGLVVESILPGGLVTVAKTEPMTDCIATILNGESMSSTIDLRNVGVPVALVMPAAWTAAVITAQVAITGASFVDLRDRFGVEWSATVAVDRGVILDPIDFLAWRYIRLRSGTAAVPVAQGGERSLRVVARPF